ncbi:MAG: TrmH family RNA methyltransferase [Bacteroidales bacterium]
MKKLSMEELGRKTPEQFLKADKFPLMIVLDNVRSMMNIGSVFRTADAFLLEGILLCGITATPPHREIHKTALGATDTVHWKYYEDTLQAVGELKEQGYTVLALEQVAHSIDLASYEPEIGQKYALVFGNEVQGVQQQVVDQCHGCLEIPQFGTKHSLNISVSAGMVIWDFYSKLLK